jgi:uncharacterized protein YodC (DUF2158 family)
MSESKLPTTIMWPDCAGFSIGDVVTPKCGGPRMVVYDLCPHGSGGVVGWVTRHSMSQPRHRWSTPSRAIDVTAIRARWVNADGATLEFVAPVACFNLVMKP